MIQLPGYVKVTRRSPRRVSKHSWLYPTHFGGPRRCRPLFRLRGVPDEEKVVRHDDGRTMLRHHEGRLERVRKCSTISSKPGAEEYERRLKTSMLAPPSAQPKEVPKFAAFSAELTRTYVAANNKPSERAPAVSRTLAETARWATPRISSFEVVDSEEI